jgi:1,2-diacylglycerol 3-beta-galactosyltransferase
MSQEVRGRPRIVFLFSDTGGGHRSAAEAIIEALELEYPGQTAVEMVDIFRGYAPPLLDRVPDFYPPLSRMPKLLGLIFHLSDGSGRTSVFLRILWPFVRGPLNRLISEHPADLFVSVHPLINAPLGEALERSANRTPYVTVVTDLVTTHATWFWKRSDLVVVPTEAARLRGIQQGYPAERLRVAGLPVAERCGEPDSSREKIRARLGWPQNLPIVMLVGGGEGVGPLEQMAKAIDSACLPVALAVVTGRNTKLKARLEQYPWQMPVHVYGFIQNMPDCMRAADVLVTKAGPGTISEALAAGLPIILYSRLDGPEEGNVGYVVDAGAGVWAPGAEGVATALRRWLEHPEERERAAKAGLSLARPRAAREIANIIMERIGMGEA